MKTPFGTAPMPAEVAEAKELGRPFGIVIATVPERRDPKVPGDYIDVWVVYRRRVRMGKRREPGRVLAFVRQLIAADQANQRERAHATA